MTIDPIFGNSIEKDFDKFLESSRKLSIKHFDNKIKFYTPSFINYEIPKISQPHYSFPSISITGDYCALKCKHCDGKILKTMIPALTPEELFDICRKLKARGCLGCLISGGSTPDGAVPLDKFSGALARIKRELGMMIVVHTGIVNSSTVKKLKDAGIDAALIDIIGSDETIQEICQIKKTVRNFDQSMKILREYEIPFVPHIIVGLHHGKLKGEFKAIEIISKYNPAAIVIISFMPMIGTKMENIEPPVPEDIAKVIISTRYKLPDVPIVLGCVRPLGEHRIKTDILALRAGINGIAFPSEKAITFAKSIGLDASFSSICCSQIYMEYGDKEV